LSIRSCGLSAAASTLNAADCAATTRSNSRVGSNGPAAAGATTEPEAVAGVAVATVDVGVGADAGVTGGGAVCAVATGGVAVVAATGGAGLPERATYRPPAPTSTSTKPVRANKARW